MPASGSYYKSSGTVSLIGLVKAGLLTIIFSFILSWVFIWAKYSVSLDWLQLLFILFFALSLSALHRISVRFGKFQNRLVDVLWSLFTVACGTYASWIFRVARLHPDHPIVVLPSSVWSGMKEAYSYGVQYYVSISRMLEPGMHTETDPGTTIIIELGVLAAVVVLSAVFLSREEFFCRECDNFFDIRAELGNLNMPQDWTILQKNLEIGDSSGLLELSRAPEQQLRLKVAVFRCHDESHPGIIRITRLGRKSENGKKRGDDVEKVLIKGIYTDSAQCDSLQDYLKSLKKA